MKLGEIKIHAIDYDPPERAEVTLDTGEVLEMEVSCYYGKTLDESIYYTSIDWVEFKDIELYHNPDYISRPMTIKPELLQEIVTKILKYCKDNPNEMQIRFYELKENEEVKEQQSSEAEEQSSQQITLKQLGEQTQTQSKNENNITSMHTESDSDKKLDMNSSSSSNGMGKQ